MVCVGQRGIGLEYPFTIGEFWSAVVELDDDDEGSQWTAEHPDGQASEAPLPSSALVDSILSGSHQTPVLCFVARVLRRPGIGG